MSADVIQYLERLRRRLPNDAAGCAWSLIASIRLMERAGERMSPELRAIVGRIAAGDWRTVEAARAAGNL